MRLFLAVLLASRFCYAWQLVPNLKSALALDSKFGRHLCDKGCRIDGPKGEGVERSEVEDESVW